MMETKTDAVDDTSTISVGLTRWELLLALIDCPVPLDEFVARYDFNIETGVSHVVVSWCNEITDDDEEW